MFCLPFNPQVRSEKLDLSHLKTQKWNVWCLLPNWHLHLFYGKLIIYVKIFRFTEKTRIQNGTAWQIYTWQNTWLFELIIYILPFTLNSRGKCEIIISLPVSRAWRGLLPPAVFRCCCPCSLCLTLSSKTKLTLHLQEPAHWGQLRHYFAIPLIQSGAQLRALFIAALISSYPLDPTSHRCSCWKYSLLRLQTGAAGHCIAFTLSNTHIRSASTPE